MLTLPLTLDMVLTLPLTLDRNVIKRVFSLLYQHKIKARLFILFFSDRQSVMGVKVQSRTSSARAQDESESRSERERGGGVRGDAEDGIELVSNWILTSSQPRRHA